MRKSEIEALKEQILAASTLYRELLGRVVCVKGGAFRKTRATIEALSELT